MPDVNPYCKEELDKKLQGINAAVYKIISNLEIEAWRTPEPVPFDKRSTGTRLKLSIGDAWGRLFDCAWFHFSGKVPASAKGSKVVLLLDVNGEMCVVDNDGAPVLGLTNGSSVFDPSYWQPKRVSIVSKKAAGGEKVDLWADAGCNDLFGNLAGDGTVKEAYIAICREDLRRLCCDFQILYDLFKVVPENSARHDEIFQAIMDAAGALDSLSVAEVKAARVILARVLSKKGAEPSLEFSAIGHAHIDLGWLWPIRETKRKGARTFATVLDLMNRYPEYKFGASQAQLLQWMKESYPKLYAGIKQKVSDRKFEVQGAMWVEADTNLTGGESLVRQVLQGKQFWKKEFGIDVRHLWLPDVFGYSGALPQILRKSGVDYFLTTKMSWNQVNKFPHHSFVWQGIDGTGILAHMPPEDTYNSLATPGSVSAAEKNYKNKNVSSHAMLLFGVGDGGGGPGEEHLERLARMKNLAGLAPVTQTFAADFFKKWSAEAAKFQTWVGELYLERHQGTFTTQAKNKWYNRRMEHSLREMEWTSTIAAALCGSKYPRERLADIWRETLLYQFHDILPGSSIKRVYDESRARYALMLKELEEGIAGNLEKIAGRVDISGVKKPVLIFNSLSWERKEWVSVNRRWIEAVVPAMGYKVFDLAAAGNKHGQATASSGSLENEQLRITFAADGSIASIFDKLNGREVLAPRHRANRLAVYKDESNAWEVAMNYPDSKPRFMKLKASTALTDGPQAILEQTYEIGHSRLVQRIVLTTGSRRLDFVTHVDWHETNSMLRTSFPVAVLADEACCNIQFGYVRRPTHDNTTWDMAKGEVPAQKWVDLSQRDHGVALMNDCKYGHRIKGNTLDLNLLRGAQHPGAVVFDDSKLKPGEYNHKYGDQGDHEFTYSLYPHAGDHVEGRVMQAAYELNIPMRSLVRFAGAGKAAVRLPSSASLIAVSSPDVIVEAVKTAEDGDDMIVRLYEAAKATTCATVRFGLPVKSVDEVDLMEENPVRLKLNGNSVKLDFHPFEIKTIKVRT